MASTQRTRVAVSAVLCYSAVRYLSGLDLLWILRARESGIFTNIVWNCMFACCVCFCLPLCVNAVHLYCPLRLLFSLPPPSPLLISGGRPTWSHPVCLYYCLPLYRQFTTCTLLKLHLALSLLVVACTFSSLTSHCRLTCIGWLVGPFSAPVSHGECPLPTPSFN